MLRAQQGAAEAEDEFRTTVADALKAGGSVREVARVTGLSTNTVQRWGRERGWPTEAQRAGWSDEKASVDEFQSRIDAATAVLRQVGDE